MTALTSKITTTINGVRVTQQIPNRMILSDFLRGELGLTGTKVSCELEVCGVCTVLVDDRPISSCTFLAVDIDGSNVQTVEGLAEGENLHPLQTAFVECFALQCGFCTPGFLMMSKALLDENPDPTEEEVRHHLEGNICRCTGYRPIVEAVLSAAQESAANKAAAGTSATSSPARPPEAPPATGSAARGSLR